jgi:hypothetical protein
MSKLPLGPSFRTQADSSRRKPKRGGVPPIKVRGGEGR